MNSNDVGNSVSNFWLSCMLNDKTALCEQKIGETSVEHVKSSEKALPQRDLAEAGRANDEDGNLCICNKLAEKYDMTILCSCHPCSRQCLEATGFKLDEWVRTN